MGDQNAPDLEQGRRSLVIDFDGTITQDDVLDDMARLLGDPVVYQEVEDA
jgi:phosphatidate phosphatase PAH1